MDSASNNRSNGSSSTNGTLTANTSQPLFTLPPQVPRQSYRRAQSNIPDDKTVRNQLKQAAQEHIDRAGVVPPLTLEELAEHTATLLQRLGMDLRFKDYVAVLVNNAAWRETLAQTPYERRLLLVPKCLRIEDKCPAPFDEFGLLCKECGLCSIQDLTEEAGRLGYAVLVAEGSAIVRQMIETGKIEVIVGVSCLNVLEKSFPHIEAAAVPSIAIPLLQDDCVNTTVDLDWVWDTIHLSSDDKTYRLDLDGLKKEVQSWFSPESLVELLGAATSKTDEIAYEWLARSGKRWRPYLATCAYMALQSESYDKPPPPSTNLKKLALAIECFHKASLVHDDIEDNDDIRYGQETLHVEQGIPIALNVGDFLLGMGYRLISELDIDSDTTSEMLRLASLSHLTLCRGQGTELYWSRFRGVLSSVQILDIFRQKTAPAFESALRLGACLGGADSETHDVLAKYSESLGIAYQIRDDLEDHCAGGDSNDLEDMRPSLILAIAHKRATREEEKDLIAALWNGDKAYADVATHVQQIIEEREVRQKATDLLEAYREEAIRSLRFLSNATLKGLLRRVVGKIFTEQIIEGYCSEFEARNATGRTAGPPSA